jgi:ankyrin repeat protein
MRRAIVAAVLVASAACGGGPPLTAIGAGWFVDAGKPGQPAPHLYHETGGKRVLVDRQIEAYRLYVDRCLIYEAPRADGRYLFVAWGGLTPVAFRESIGPSRWRLDGDGPRRFEAPMDPDGRHLLAIEWINFGDPCYTAQLQPRFTENWAASTPTRVVADRIKIEESTIDVDGEDTVGNSMLSNAAAKGEVILVDELLRAGADANSANHAGVSALMTAVGFRHPEVVHRLIAAGARVDTQDAGGETALMYAAKYRNLEMMKMLIAAGAKTTIRDDRGRTASVWVPDGDRDDLREMRTLLESRQDGQGR